MKSVRAVAPAAAPYATRPVASIQEPPSSAASWVACWAARSVGKARERSNEMLGSRRAFSSDGLPSQLLPGRLAQRLVDAVLPSRAALLEPFQHVLVDAQRDLLAHTGNGALLGWRFGRLDGCALERGFRLGTGVIQRA